MSETCRVCGLPLAVGEFGCITTIRPHGAYGVAVIDDAIEGGPRFFETFGHEPVFIASKSQWRREVDQRKDEIVHVDRHDRAYYQKRFKMHDEELRDTRTDRADGL